MQLKRSWNRRRSQNKSRIGEILNKIFSSFQRSLRSKILEGKKDCCK